ncbi:hypothetical protein JAAARDRAFT_189442 [Jaapia argillacea MUCL 33604]|uniref:G domain-containing protein n=1 Tax=Jaapia argillacea MUCL 33604 TaxID=933084 RepID=A0A067QEY8_9AGAM|nr:hypothetical protein JAAARDRAFT_189442 [Jaapia argillacea MUCL 33604]
MDSSRASIVSARSTWSAGTPATTAPVLPKQGRDEATIPPNMKAGSPTPQPSSYPNVIIFGESGAGKSSIVNMLAGKEITETSGDLLGCTFESRQYTVDLPDRAINIFDTAGLNEGLDGTVTSVDAIKNLYKLVHSMENGVNLLVYVVRGPRIRQSTRNNYYMFYEAFCRKEVPIVLVVTGLEQEASRDAWWERNASVFQECGMHFEGHACVVGTRGRRMMFEKEYEESREDVVDLITRTCLSRPPWRMKGVASFMVILKSMYNSVLVSFPAIPPAGLAKALYRALREAGGLSKVDAKRTASSFERELIEELGRDKKKDDTQLSASPTLIDMPLFEQGRGSHESTANVQSVNVILFGAEGCGKSSIINMLASKNIAHTSDGACGCTFATTKYSIESDPRMTVNLFETAGLNEGVGGTVGSHKAVAKLYTLLRDLHGGVSLLVYVVRGRITDSTIVNYRLFYEAICGREVPLVLLATGVENEDSPDRWLRETLQECRRASIDIASDSAAWVTPIKGKRDYNGNHIFQREYDASIQTVRNLIHDRSSIDPWKVDLTTWFTSILKSLPNLMYALRSASQLSLAANLQDEGLSLSEARGVANVVQGLIGGEISMPGATENVESVGEKRSRIMGEKVRRRSLWPKRGNTI